MTVLSRILPIPLPVDVVWGMLTDVDAWARWMPHVLESGWTDPDAPLAPGRRLWFRLHHESREPRIEAEVSVVRPGREFTYRPIGGDLPYVEGMEELEWQWLLYQRPLGCSTRWTVSYTARGGFPMMREVIGARIQLLNQADNVLLALFGMAEGDGPAAVLAEA